MRHSATCSVRWGEEDTLSDLLLFRNYKMIETVSLDGLKRKLLKLDFFFPSVKCQ